ncbi:hypothetical protein P8605_13210, partial [Streptomyces sp. T-3]|nr:hypothetical protein [Streptomyces sp. T-3]
SAIAGSVSDLEQAIQDAAENPLEADKALDKIDQNLGEITDKTDNVDVNKGVDDLQKAVDNVRTAIKNGDNTPDLGPVLDASGEITKACTS